MCGPLLLLEDPCLLLELGPVLTGDLHCMVLRNFVFILDPTEETTHLERGEGRNLLV